MGIGIYKIGKSRVGKDRGGIRLAMGGWTLYICSLPVKCPTKLIHKL